MNTSKEKFVRRRERCRAKLKKVAAGRLRLTIFKSNQHIHAQLIDDQNGVTVAHASTQQKDFTSLKSKKNIQAAQKVGAKIGKEISAKKLSDIVFDKSGYLYHGVIASFVDAVRETGVKI